MRTDTSRKPLRPLLKWIGGKRRLARKLRTYIPELEGSTRYWEPFIGAASIFLILRPERATLGDSNEHLVSFYRHLRARPDLIELHLKKWRLPFSKARYLTLRSEFNACKDSYRRAALFIALNRTAFNGMWRVSRKGSFNVPYNKKRHLRWPAYADLLEHAKAFRGKKIVAADFESQLQGCRKGDFVYLDPPYPPINGTAFFTHYTAARFSEADQARLAATVERLTHLGCRVMVSNAGTPAILKRYRGYRLENILTTRMVAARGVRHRVSDVVILNYDHKGRVYSRY